MRHWAVAVLGAAAAGAASATSAAGGGPAEEVLVSLEKGGYVGLSTRGPTAIRVRLLRDAKQEPIDTPMVAPDHADAPFERTHSSGWIGIKTKVGSATVSRAGLLQLRDSEGAVLTESEPLAGSGSVFALSSSVGRVYGRGASPEDARELTSNRSRPVVCNRGTNVPYYYSSDGYAALGVVSRTKNFGHFPASYDVSSDEKRLWWSFEGPFELYLMPAETLRESTVAYFGLVGRPRVPPRYAFGFMASRWGWESKAYIEDTISKFRRGKYPVDAVIMDFEWFVNETDYPYDAKGKPYYQDFGFNPALWPSPREQLSRYRKDFNIRVGLLRKPRIGNSKLLDLARSKGYLLERNFEPGGTWPQNVSQGYAQNRCIDFSKADARQWYAEMMSHYIDDGVEFWWNDEGEMDFYTFHWWCVAEAKLLHAKHAAKRFFSLNRAFSPGMSRLGGAAWTGDITPTWKDMSQQPGMILNWGISGAPFTGCDIGGFTGNSTPALLARWMQLGAFLPLMRTHSTCSPWATPHWPWLWGDRASGAIRQALELRYRLVPYHYSLAHKLYDTGVLYVRPLAMEFPDDLDAAEITSQWMDGDILVAPILEENSSRQIYFPEGAWYSLRASSITQSPTNCDKCQRVLHHPKGDVHHSVHLIQGPVYMGGQASYTEVPAFVRAGTVLPLAPVVQYTDALPGGPLEVQVYAGADGSFDLIEDDGETMAYEAGAVRTTRLRWSDSTSTLSWEVVGSVLAPGKQGFTQIFATLYHGTGSYTSQTKPINIGGSIRLMEEDTLV